MVEVRHLKALIAVVEEGSFRNGAKRLGISQPSLSQQIARLEDHVGAMLFDRKPDGVELTRCGRVLYDQALDVLGMIDEARDRVRAEAVRRKEVVRVAAIPTMAPFVLPRAIRLLRDESPDVAVIAAELPMDELIDAVIRRDVDIGVLSSVPEKGLSTCEVHHHGEEPLLLAIPGGSKWAKRPHLCGDDLQEAGVIVLGEMHCLNVQVLEFCETQSIDRIVQIESGQVATLVELVRQDVGVTLLPAALLAGLDTTGVEIRELKGERPMRPIHSVKYPQRSPSDIVALMSRCIDAVYKRYRAASGLA